MNELTPKQASCEAGQGWCDHCMKRASMSQAERDTQKAARKQREQEEFMAALRTGNRRKR